MLSKTSRAWNGFMALVDVIFVLLVFRVLWGIGGAIPEIWADASAAGKYEGFGVMVFIAVVMALLGSQLGKDAYLMGYRALTGKNAAQDNVKIEFDTEKLEFLLREIRVRETFVETLDNQDLDLRLAEKVKLQAEENHRVA